MPATQYATAKRSEIQSKNSPAVKKVCSPEESHNENDVKSAVEAKKCL